MSTDKIPLASDRLLEALGIGRRPRGGEGWLLSDVSLELRPDERVALRGPSGAGKSLLLRGLALLDPRDAGEVRWCGAEVRREAIPAFRARVLYVAQRPVLFEGSVEENLRRPFELGAHARASFDRERAAALFADLGRDGSFLERSHRDLSGGEAQIVALVRALQLDPDVLLLDEPTASLDAEAGRRVEARISAWASGGARSLVWVSHDASQAGRVAGRQIVVRGGRLEPGA